MSNNEVVNLATDLQVEFFTLERPKRDCPDDFVR